MSTTVFKLSVASKEIQIDLFYPQSHQKTYTHSTLYIWYNLILKILRHSNNIKKCVVTIFFLFFINVCYVYVDIF